MIRNHLTFRAPIAVSLALISFLSSCGYKSPPSPFLDEKERFAPIIERKAEENAKIDSESSRGAFSPPKTDSGIDQDEKKDSEQKQKKTQD